MRTVDSSKIGILLRARYIPDPVVRGLVKNLDNCVKSDYGKPIKELSQNDVFNLSKDIAGETPHQTKEPTRKAMDALKQHVFMNPDSIKLIGDYVSAAPAWAWICVAVFVVVLVVSITSRYTFINVRPGVIAVGDRWTGCTEMRSYSGKTIGSEC